MHFETTQRVLIAIAGPREAAAPIVEHEFQRAYDLDWKERVNAERQARSQLTGRGMHDHRFVLGLVAHESSLAGVFDDGEREAA